MPGEWAAVAVARGAPQAKPRVPDSAPRHAHVAPRLNGAARPRAWREWAGICQACQTCAPVGVIWCRRQCALPKSAAGKRLVTDTTAARNTLSLGATTNAARRADRARCQGDRLAFHDRVVLHPLNKLGWLHLLALWNGGVWVQARVRVVEVATP